MKKGGRLATVLLIGFLVISGVQHIQAGDGTQPELKDTRNDSLKKWDILSGWFHESTNDKNILQVTIQMHTLSRIPSAYKVLFDIDSTEYKLNLTIKPLSIPRFQLTIKNENTIIHTVKGNIDFVEYLITFKIPKNICPQMKRGSLITNTSASAELNWAHFLPKNSLIHSYVCDVVHGSNYKIQY